jgi:hypothetical protein
MPSPIHPIARRETCEQVTQRLGGRMSSQYERPLKSNVIVLPGQWTYIPGIRGVFADNMQAPRTLLCETPAGAGHNLNPVAIVSKQADHVSLRQALFGSLRRKQASDPRRDPPSISRDTTPARDRERHGTTCGFFAAALPHLIWQTSDCAHNLPGISAWLDEAALPNLPPSLMLDVMGPWPDERFDAVFSANTAHIMSEREVGAMFDGVGHVSWPRAATSRSMDPSTSAAVTRARATPASTPC